MSGLGRNCQNISFDWSVDQLQFHFEYCQGAEEVNVVFKVQCVKCNPCAKIAKRIFFQPPKNKNVLDMIVSKSHTMSIIL